MPTYNVPKVAWRRGLNQKEAGVSWHRDMLIFTATYAEAVRVLPSLLSCSCEEMSRRARRVVFVDDA